LRRSRRIYKRKTRSNIETLIILMGAIVILSVAFYMAREKSYLPPLELESEQQTIAKNEITKLNQEEQREPEELIVPDVPAVKKPSESEISVTPKPVEKEASIPAKEQVVQKESNLTTGQAPSVPPKQEPPVRQVETPAPSGTVYTVQVGYFTLEANARSLAKEIENRGFQVLVIKHNNSYKVQVGAYPMRGQAEEAAQQLKKLGYEIWITQR